MKQPGSPLSRLVRCAHRYTAVVAVRRRDRSSRSGQADTTPLAMLDPNLQVTTVLTPASISRSASCSWGERLSRP